MSTTTTTDLASDNDTKVGTKGNVLNEPPIIKRKVGRPGRKKIDTESKNKRTQQNRIAQRAYRERKEQKLKNLENKIVWLEQLNLQNLNEINFINYNLKRLLDDLKQYRSFNDDDLFLLNFLNEKNEIKGLINNEINKIDKKLKDSNITNDGGDRDLKLNNDIPLLPTTNSNNNGFNNFNFNLTNTWVNTTSTTNNNNNNNNNNNSRNYDSSPDIIDNNINSSSSSSNSNIWDSFPQLDNLTSIYSNDILDFNNAFEDNKYIYNDNLKLKNIDNNDSNTATATTTTTTNKYNSNINDGIYTVLNNVAFPDIWDNSSNDAILNDNINNNNDLVSNLNILPFDCDCGGACFNNQIPFENKYNNSNKVMCDSGCNSACNSDEEDGTHSNDEDDDDNAIIKCDLLTRHILNKESIQSIINDKNFLNNNNTDTINNKFPLSCSHFIKRIKVKDETSFENEVEKLCNELMVKCRHDPINESILLEKGDLKKAIVS